MKIIKWNEFNKLKESMEIRLKYDIALPEDIIHIKDVFKKASYKLYLVGGSVRDAYIDHNIKDYDLATNATPDKVQELLKPYYQTLETGKAFGVINAICPNGTYEIATFRKDIGAGRRPDSVEFTTIEGDTERRDLTINALFYDIDTHEIVDLVGGLKDLDENIVRTVGDPTQRFREDKLRILRFCRFVARFDSNIDPIVDKALLKDSSLVGISKERIRDEFLKGILSAKNVENFLELLMRYDLFKWIFPGLICQTDFTEEKDYIVLIAHILRKNDPELLKRIFSSRPGYLGLAYTSDEINKIYFLVRFQDLSIETAYKLKKLELKPDIKDRISDDQIKKFAKLCLLNSHMVDVFTKWNLVIKGDELQNKGFVGSAISREMERLETENFKSLLNK